MKKIGRPIKVIFRCDGSKAIGMGHLSRDTILADELKKRMSASIIFIVKNNLPAIRYLKNKGFIVEMLPNTISKKRELHLVKQILNKHIPDIFIVDILEKLYDRNYLKILSLNKKIILVVFSDTACRKVIDADIVFYFNPCQRIKYYRHIKNTKYYVGLKYFIMAGTFSVKSNKFKVNRSIKRVLICMGGSDQHNLTFKLLSALSRSKYKFGIIVILSSCYFERNKFSKTIKHIKKKVQIVYDAPDLCALFRKCDFAITSGGNTHIERIIVGIPGMVICQSRREDEIANYLERKRVTINLGMYNKMNEGKILDNFEKMASDFKRRSSISANSIHLVQGGGLKKIINIIGRYLGNKVIYN